MIAVAPTATSGSRAISGAPENDATELNMSGWRAAYVVEPNPPCESPAIARPCLPCTRLVSRNPTRGCAGAAVAVPAATAAADNARAQSARRVRREVMRLTSTLGPPAPAQPFIGRRVCAAGLGVAAVVVGVGGVAAS